MTLQGGTHPAQLKDAVTSQFFGLSVVYCMKTDTDLELQPPEGVPLPVYLHLKTAECDPPLHVPSKLRRNVPVS